MIPEGEVGWEWMHLYFRADCPTVVETFHPQSQTNCGARGTKSGELQRLQDLSSGDHESSMVRYDVIVCLDQNSRLTDKLKSSVSKKMLPVGLKT